MIPDKTMADVRLVHDQCGSYADWILVEVDGVRVMPYGTRTESYLLGDHPPNYPVPALYIEAVEFDPCYVAVLYRGRNTEHGYWVQPTILAEVPGFLV